MADFMTLWTEGAMCPRIIQPLALAHMDMRVPTSARTARRFNFAMLFDPKEG